MAGHIYSSFDKNNILFKDIKLGTQVWMSHGDTITSIPGNFKKIASTDEVAIAATRLRMKKYGEYNSIQRFIIRRRELNY